MTLRRDFTIHNFYFNLLIQSRCSHCCEGLVPGNIQIARRTASLHELVKERKVSAHVLLVGVYVWPVRILSVLRWDQSGGAIALDVLADDIQTMRRVCRARFDGHPVLCVFLGGQSHPYLVLIRMSVPVLRFLGVVLRWYIPNNEVSGTRPSQPCSHRSFDRYICACPRPRPL